MPDELLTTAQLAERTGLRSGTLRMWEARYGFPIPERLPGGHHRYGPGQAELVERVLSLRATGLSLGASIERARQEAQPPQRSIFAALRLRRPDLQVQTVAKRSLLALTHAIEDEHLVRAGRGVAVGSFQAERNFRASEHRWRELAAGDGSAVALADFAELRERAGAPAEVPISSVPEMDREWTLIVSGPAGGACLAAWEPPAARPVKDSQRPFEAIWSFEPASVRDALRAAFEVITPIAPRVAARVAEKTGDLTVSEHADLRFASDLSHRAFGYLAAEIDRTIGIAR